ncbi:MAG: hypothetical protein ACI4RP_06455 [Acutalibacteraceae bacterium]
MSRKNDELKNRYGSLDESDDFREDIYQPPQQDEEEEAVDISAFGLEYQAQQSDVQSEEAKKIAELMASIGAEGSGANSLDTKSKRTKKKKERKPKTKKEKKRKQEVGVFAEDYDGQADDLNNAPEYDSTDDYSYTQPEEYETSLPSDLDGDFAQNDYEVQDYEPEYENEPVYAEEPDFDDDFMTEDEASSGDFDDTYPQDDKMDDEASDGEYREEEEFEYSQDEDEPEFDEEPEAETEDEPEETVNDDNADNTVKKQGLLQRIRAFWSGSEDFEEKFGDDFDSSVFDDEETPQENGEEPEQKDSEEAETDEPDEMEETEEPEEAQDEAQADEDDYTEDEDNAEDEQNDEKPRTVFDKIKAFWNGEDIKNKSVEDEEITDEEIEAEVEAEKSEWIKSSVKYDDLSEYAPKQREKVKEESSEAFEYDEDFKAEGKSGIFDIVKGRVKAFLKPSLGDNAESEQEDEIEENYERNEDEDTDRDGEADEEYSEEIKKASPIQQIKNLWNEDDSYADEDEQADDEDDEDDPIDARFADEEEKPVATKPVLTVIASTQEDDDSADGEEDEIEEKITGDEPFVTESSQSVEEYTEDDDIISEGPDAPTDVVSSISHRKKGLLTRLKSIRKSKSEKKEKDKSKKAKEEKADGKADEELIAEASQPTQNEAETAVPTAEERADSEKAADEYAVEESTVAAATAQEAAAEMKTEPATFEEVAQRVQIDSVDGRQIVNGRVVPKYVHEDLVEKISLTNENIPLVVRREYEEYIRQAKYRPNLDSESREVNSEVSKAVKEEINNPEKAEKKAKRQKEESKETTDSDEKPKPQKQERKSIKDMLFGDVENSADFSEFRAQTNLNPQNDQVIEDYDKPSDARAIRAEINYDNRKVAFRCITLAVLFVITLAFSIIQRYFPTVLTQNIPNADIMTCLISLILLIIAAVLCHSTVIGGLKPLIAFKGNSDTAVAVAVVGCLAQGVVSFFEPQAFFSGGMHLYSILAITALLLNNLGKLYIVQRIKANFRFVSSPNRKYAARIYEDEQVSNMMIEGSNAEKPVVALQSRTRFLKGFLKFSYMPDPSERAASFLAPITTVIAVLVAIICGISNGTVASSVSAFSIVACMGIPMSCLLAVNIPMKKLCTDSLKNRSMIIGYPAVKTFAETGAVMVDSRELYPRGRVQLLSVKTFNTYNIDKALLNAAAVMKVANTPMTYMFEDVISEKGEQLPEVESVKYEDGNGLVSWVGGERLLLGNRELMKKYSINLPSVDFEESSVESKGNCITYLANAGQLVAMLVTDYQADQRLAAELSRLEKNGVAILIRTADPNVTQIKVARDFGVFIRNVRILPTALGNICKDEMSRREDSSRAFISTEGKLHSLARAISGCIKIKNNIMIAIVIQVIAVALGVLIAAVVSVFSGLNGLHGLDLLFYVVFWAVASIIAPLLQKA